MANEIQTQAGFGAGVFLYFLIRNSVSQVYNNSTQLFEVYNSQNYSSYVNGMNQQGTVSGFYAGSFPTAITAGIYSISIVRQLGGIPAEGDSPVASGDYQWNGQITLPLSNIANSGQIAGFAPVKVYCGEQINNFPFYLVTSGNHISPFTSGICSGQISQDGAPFIALQSGIFNETGFGIYNVTLTSGDLLCNTAALRFTGVGVSGDVADPRVFTLFPQLSNVANYIVTNSLIFITTSSGNPLVTG